MRRETLLKVFEWESTNHKDNVATNRTFTRREKDSGRKAVEMGSGSTDYSPPSVSGGPRPTRALCPLSNLTRTRRGRCPLSHLTRTRRGEVPTLRVRENVCE